VNWRRPDGECSDPTSPLRMAISLSPVCPTPVDAAILGAVKKPVKHGPRGLPGGEQPEESRSIPVSRIYSGKWNNLGLLVIP
jgi:hypothetical protein